MRSFIRIASNFFVLTFCLLLLSQCNKSEVTSLKEIKTPFEVSLKDAVEVAQTYNELQSQAVPQNSKARMNANTEIIGQETIVDDVSKQPLFHIVNYSKGFTMVSADLRTLPILAYSSESKFDSKNVPNGVEIWFESTKKEIKKVRDSHQEADSIVIKEWKKYLAGNLNLPRSGGRASANTNCEEWYRVGQFMCQNSTSVHGPLLNTEWGQDNISSTSLTWITTSCGPCARVAAGCGPVAMAQVYQFYNPNSSLPSTSDYSCSAVTNGEYQLGQLMLTCGIAANSQYHAFGTCNTFTVPSNIPGALSGMGFSNGGNTNSTSFNFQTVYNELRGNHPVILWGSTCFTCSQNAHIWVCDGLDEHFYSQYDCDTHACEEMNFNYLHMNWGWDGDFNGWYGYGQYNPGNGGNYFTALYTISGIRP